MPNPTQFRLDHYPSGPKMTGVWRQTFDPVGSPDVGEVRVELAYLSVDPGMRGWITPKRSYMPPVQPGEVMRAFGVGEVVDSNADGFAVGDWVTGFTGVQTEACLNAAMLRKIDISHFSPHLYLSGLGMTGYTGYFGMSDIGRPGAGDTVVVSAAAGAVGSIAAQVASKLGARVVGIAGGSEKCAYLLDQLKLDAAIDYKCSDIEGQLAATCPDGIDVYFDNVGGETLDAVLALINRHGRIVVCGGISQYGDMDSVKGPANYLQIVAQSVTMRGFTMRDYLDRIPEAFIALAGWHMAGEIVFREHMVCGIEQFPQAFDMLFRGGNHGKLLIEI